MAGEEDMIAVGIGCRRGASAAQVGAAVHQALNSAQISVSDVDVLAVPIFKANEAGVKDAAAALDLPLTLVARPALEAVQALCVTRSEVAAETIGLDSVAEAAALAGAGATSALILPRIVVGSVTCAVARAGAP
jgi:cobalt-precorrin 5A hydrolase